MSTRLFTRRFALLSSAALLLTPSAARAQDAQISRALIVTVSYQGQDGLQLANTTNDGVLIADTLTRLNFQSVDRVADPDPIALHYALTRFVSQLDENTIAFFYVAAHGVQVSGRNFILLEDGVTLVDLAPIVASLRSARGPVVLLLDACRNNPLESQESAELRAARGVDGRTRSAGGIALETVGLEQMNTIARVGELELGGSGVGVMYATDPRNVAADGASPADRNSPFARALAERLPAREALSVIMESVTNDVSAATGQTQSPWWSSSIGRQIFLAGRPPRGNPTRIPSGIPG